MARPLKDDFTGKVIGRLTVVERDARGQYRESMWLCKCECGVERLFTGNQLRTQRVKSCGCWRRKAPVIRNTTHGKRHSRVYGIWNAMKQRCHNPNQPHFERYGGRGITVCDEWRKSFEAFYADMGDPPSDGHSIDRIDNHQGYAPGNCRWATSLEQAHNKR